MSARSAIQTLTERMNAAIVGQSAVVERIVIGLLANGNLLVEGLPGLAKTRAIKALADNVEADFSRIQFTPDLLPADVTGTEVFYQKDGSGEFRFEPGPIFANIVLGDEINRAPAKVQSAMLEAMEERQVTVAGTTHRMPALFMVMATQNPVEQEGTYPLPEAQLDRFLMHVNIDYPSVEDEVAIIELVRGEESAQHAPEGPKEKPEPLPQQAIFEARQEIAAIQTTPAVLRYMADLVWGTRDPARLDGDLDRWIDVGSSPRASLALDRCSRAHAWLAGRSFVDPEDVRAIAHDVLRHRLMLSYEAQGDSIRADQVIDRLLEQVALP
ncbi:MAG: MoxR family ATPase [Pseudomonadota bacterium]